MIRKVFEVKANDDFTIDCEMENGEVYRYDMSFIQTDKGIMAQPLKDIDFFKRVWLDEVGALEWPNGFGIHGNKIARDGELIKKSA